MGTKLSHKLLDLGFFSALGTVEHAGPEPKKLVVTRGTPNTYDSNNGVLVVYDEEGRPWIRGNDRREPSPAAAAVEVVASFKLTRGAHVPHSNDGEYFVREVLPTL